MQDKEKKVLKIVFKSCLIIGLMILAVIKIDEIIAYIDKIINIITPFIIGLVLAYILTPIANKIENKLSKSKHKKLVHNFATLISELILIIVVAVIVLLIVPQMLDSITTIIKTLYDASDNMGNTIENHREIVDAINKLLGKNIEHDLLNIRTVVLNTVTEKVLPNADFAIGLITGAKQITSVIYDITMGFMMSIFALSNRSWLANSSKTILNKLFGKTIANAIIDEAKIANKIFSGFFIGKVIDSIIIGVVCFVCTYLMQIPYAGLISLIVGITNIVPIFGPLIGAIPGIIIVLAEDPFKSLCFLVFIIILQQIDGHIIGPKLVGSSTGLNTLLVLLALVIFGGLWGLLGMLIGVPLMAVILDLVSKLLNYIEHKREEKELKL